MARTRSSGGGASTASEVAVTTTELRELIANGENSGVEFKSDVIENRQLAKELVAFANLQGGCVLLGIDDPVMSNLATPAVLGIGLAVSLLVAIVLVLTARKR